MISGYISKVRREENNTLYDIAGDMFRGFVIDSGHIGISTIQWIAEYKSVTNK